MFLRKLGKRGTAIIEYVILLSFVAVIGTSFTSDSGMGGSIKSIITNVEQLLGLAAGNAQQGRLNFQENAQQYAEGLNKLFNAVIDATPQGLDPFSYKIYKYKDGKASIEYVYKKDGIYNDSETVHGVDLSFLSDEKYSYTISGETFISVKDDGSFNTSDYGRPTRIVVKDKKTGKESYLKLDPDTQTFFKNNGYFSELY